MIGLIHNENDSYLLNKFKIEYDKVNNNSKFPETFTIDLSSASLKEFNIIKFVKIANGDFYHPVTSSNFYINDHSKLNVKKLNSNVLNEYVI